MDISGFNIFHRASKLHDYSMIEEIMEQYTRFNKDDIFNLLYNSRSPNGVLPFNLAVMKNSSKRGKAREEFITKLL